jgi:hypothetical protein
MADEEKDRSSGLGHSTSTDDSIGAVVNTNFRAGDFLVGDYVAIVPFTNSSPEQCLEIARIQSIDIYAIRLSDGRAYCRHALREIAAVASYITRASDAHWLAVEQRNHAVKCA